MNEWITWSTEKKSLQCSIMFNVCLELCMSRIMFNLKKKTRNAMLSVNLPLSQNSLFEWSITRSLIEYHVRQNHLGSIIINAKYNYLKTGNYTKYVK